jgi:hypothetical protein
MTEKVHVLNFLSDRPRRKPAGTDLERRARQIGTLAGRAVALLRQTQEKLNDEQSWSNLRDSAENRAEELRQAAVRRTQEYRRQVENSYREARERARQAAHDYPVHVALGAGLAGFIVGAALRAGRMNRAH